MINSFDNFDAQFSDTAKVVDQEMAAAVAEAARASGLTFVDIHELDL